MQERIKVIAGAIIVAIIAWLVYTGFTAQKAGATVHFPSSVTICHKEEGKNPQTKVIPFTALGGHLGHGDSIGPCPEIPVDVCKNIEGNQAEVPEGYTKDGDNCYQQEEPKDYCDTLPGVQGEDEDCPNPPQPTCEELKNCPEPPVVKHDDDDHDGSKCKAPRDIQGFRYMFEGANNRLKWVPQDNMPKVDIKVYGPDKTTFLHYIRTKDDGNELVPGHVNFYRIRGINHCGLSSWSKLVN